MAGGAPKMECRIVLYSYSHHVDRMPRGEASCWDTVPRRARNGVYKRRCRAGLRRGEEFVQERFECIEATFGAAIALDASTEHPRNHDPCVVKWAKVNSSGYFHLLADDPLKHMAEWLTGMRKHANNLRIWGEQDYNETWARWDPADDFGSVGTDEPGERVCEIRWARIRAHLIRRRVAFYWLELTLKRQMAPGGEQAARDKRKFADEFAS
jgi:hypothetical protein